MRYIPYFAALIFLLTAIVASPALAEEDKECEEGLVQTEQPCPEMQMRMEPRPDGEPGPMMRMEGPYEECWTERPWNCWRHLDEGTLDYDAIHFMGDVRTIAILPFVDATSPTNQGASKLEQAGGARRIVENLAAELMARGYLVIPPMDAVAVYQNLTTTGAPLNSQEIANNNFYFSNMPDRAMNYYMEMVPGLENQYTQSAGREFFVSTEDIRKIAEALGADAVVRGFVYEYAVMRDLDADWRTFIPPFLGLINPDRRTDIEVAYYLYDGATGEMVWNGAVEVRDDANWPLFESESEQFWGSEHEAVWQMTGRILPNWTDLVMAHPEWVPFEMWYEYGGEPCEGMVSPPGWVNPLREGWHESYERHHLRWNDHIHEAPEVRYGDLTHSYGGAQ